MMQLLPIRYEKIMQLIRLWRLGSNLMEFHFVVVNDPDATRFEITLTDES
jgi:hypothetical protein